MSVRALFFILFAVFTTSARADIAADVEAIFAKHRNNLDFAAVKAEADYLVDQSVTVETQLAQIDQMVAAVERMLPANATEWQKIETIQKYIVSVVLPPHFH